MTNKDDGGPAFPRPFSHFEDGPDIYTGYHEQGRHDTCVIGSQAWRLNGTIMGIFTHGKYVTDNNDFVEHQDTRASTKCISAYRAATPCWRPATMVKARVRPATSRQHHHEVCHGIRPPVYDGHSGRLRQAV